jgi:hypothetical protein
MKNKHQQVVDLSNPNEGQGTSALTSAIKISPNMSKQTSVEWLMIELFTMNSLTQQIIDTFEQAKEMHRQEIEAAWINGKEDDSYGFHILIDAQKYYEETFGKKTFTELKPIDLEQVKAQVWEEACNKVRESLKSNVLIQNDFFVTEINPTNPYKNEEQ